MLETQREKDLARIIPKRYLSLESDKREIVERSKGKSVFVYGKAGSGKTTFVCSCIKNEIGDGEPIDRYGFKCVFVGHADLMIQCQRLAKDPEGDAVELINRYASFQRLLVIDDLYSLKSTDYINQMTEYLINKRYENELQTTVTSNYTLKEIALHASERVASRLAEMCRGNILIFSGESRRFKTKA